MDFPGCGNAAIHADEQLRLAGQGLYCFRIKAIAFTEPCGNIRKGTDAKLLQRIQHNGAGTDTIGVIIAVNRDNLVFIRRMTNHLTGFVHIMHQEGIMQLIKRRV